MPPHNQHNIYSMAFSGMVDYLVVPGFFVGFYRSYSPLVGFDRSCVSSLHFLPLAHD